MLIYTRSVEDAYEQLQSGPQGLSAHESAQRLIQYGPNALKIKGEPLWRKLIEPFTNVFMIVLLGASVISFFQGELFDGLIILVIMAVSATIYYIQRFSTERIIRSLSKRSSQQVEVIRHGEIMSVDAALLVPGDVVRLSEGDKIPADIRLTAADGVRVDESVLTGESVPMNKSTEPLGGQKEVYEQSNILFQGSFIISGQATGVVFATGNATEFGRIAALTKQSSDVTRSPVQKKIDSLLTKIIITVAALAIVAFGLALARESNYLKQSDLS